MSSGTRAVGELLRDWRRQRRLSQLELACDAEVSSKHVSFLETGRAQPSRDMILRLAERLDVPLRDRNRMLTAAGYAPLFPERSLEHPALDLVRQAVDAVLAGHEPYPAIAIDRHWTLVSSNAAVRPLLSNIDAALLEPPVNVLRLTLHPGGLASRIANYSQWRQHVFDKLRRQIDVSDDPVLAELLRELRGFPMPDGATSHTSERSPVSFVIPFQLITAAGVLSFFSTTTVFGTPIEVTLEGLSIEAFYPANRETAEALHSAMKPGPLPAW